MNAALAVPRPPLPAPRPVAERYAHALEAGQRLRGDVDRDVLRGRALDFGRAFLPDALTRAGDLPFLKPREARLWSQVQARTYANVFAAFERCIGASTRALARDGERDAVALEALLRAADESRKHEALFQRLEAMAAAGMPDGYAFLTPPDGIAGEMLSRSTWSVLALVLAVEVGTQAHYRTTLDDDAALCEVWKDALLHHWKEESQHTILDELEWRREHARCDADARARGVDDLGATIGAIDALLQGQAYADAEYFLRHAGRAFLSAEESALRDATLRAYRRQHLAIAVQEPRFVEVLRALTTPAQFARLGAALAPVLEHACG